MTLRERLRNLYHGEGSATRRFHYGLLVFDLATIVFLVVSSFFQGSPIIEALDAVIGLAILAELIMRIAASRSLRRELFSVFTAADIAVVASLMIPMLGEGFAFLRVLRLLRLFRSYQILKLLRSDYSFFDRNERTIVATINLAIFLFFMTALVYETQHHSNEQIGNYVDALYFTVTTLTTTGFGDVTLKGSWGRLLAVVIMIVGVSLFLRLVQVMIRPYKVEHKCPDCGLMRHDIDAVHCKACGRMLNIEDEGVV
jgi:voltage-gated potassium channel